MTAVPAAPAPARSASSAGTTGVSYARLVKSENLKFWTIRSTWWLLGVTLVVMIGLALIMAFASAEFAEGSAATDGVETIGVQVITFGYTFGQIMLAVLGALFITNEFSSGMIRSTFSAAPGRTGAILAKIQVLGVTTFVTGLLATFVSYLVTYPILRSHGMHISLGDWVTWRVIIGTALYLMLIALLGLAVGLIVRNNVGSQATVLGIIFVLPLVFQILAAVGQKWAETIMTYLPSSAGEALMSVDGSVFSDVGSKSLDWWVGGLWLVGYVVVLTVLGMILVRRRDA